MDAPIVALHCNYYDNNFGDLLLLKIFEGWVRSAGPCTIVYPLVPDAEKERYQRQFPDTIVGEGPRWDALIYCGGGLFADAGADGRILLGHFARRFFHEVVPPGERAFREGIPYAILGPGAGPLTNLFVRRRAARLFRRARLVSIRDEESLDFVRNRLGVPGEIACAPDPAVTTSPEMVPPAAWAKVDRILAPYAGKVLLGVHHPRDFLYDRPSSLAARAALIEVLRGAPDVVPVFFSDIGSDSESPHAERLGALVREATGRAPLTLPFLGIWETVALIGRLSAVLTTKLHVGIVSYAMTTYCEAFPLHPKTLQFYRVTKRPDQAILFSQLDAAEARRRIERAIQRAREGRKLGDETWHDVRRRAGMHGELVRRFLGSVTGRPAPGPATGAPVGAVHGRG
jgi:polysaccharide pyruvyl transferase WcaK-like protein